MGFEPMVLLPVIPFRRPAPLSSANPQKTSWRRVFSGYLFYQRFPAASCRSQAAHLTLWGAFSFLPAFPIGGYSAFLTPAEQAVSHVFELAWMGPFFSHSEVLALKPGFLAAVQTLGGKAALDKSSAIFTPIM